MLSFMFFPQPVSGIIFDKAVKKEKEPKQNKQTKTTATKTIT